MFFFLQIFYKPFGFLPRVPRFVPTFTLETKFEKSSLFKKVNFFPRQKYGGRLFSTATVFWFETLKNKPEMEAGDWLMSFCKQTR